jgi:hypothetical protein
VVDFLLTMQAQAVPVDTKEIKVGREGGRKGGREGGGGTTREEDGVQAQSCESSARRESFFPFLPPLCLLASSHSRLFLAHSFFFSSHLRHSGTFLTVWKRLQRPLSRLPPPRPPPLTPPLQRPRPVPPLFPGT